jgi:hypothetical protein
MTTEINALWLDGNAAAGLLHEIFGIEMTPALRRCASCGDESPVAAHRLYLGAGFILRCPTCNDLAIRVTVLPDRHVVHLTGTWSLDVPRAGSQAPG